VHFAGIMCPCYSGGCNFVVFNEAIVAPGLVNIAHFAKNGVKRNASNTTYFAEVAKMAQQSGSFLFVPSGSHIVSGEVINPTSGYLSNLVWLAFFVFGQFVYVSETGVITLVVFNPVGTGVLDHDSKHYYLVRPRMDPEEGMLDSDDDGDDADFLMDDDLQLSPVGCTKVVDVLFHGPIQVRDDCDCTLPTDGTAVVNAATLNHMPSCDDAFNLPSFTAKFPARIRDVELPKELAKVPNFTFFDVSNAYCATKPVELKRLSMYSEYVKK